MSDPVKIIRPIKVISLARTPERRAEFQRRNPGLTYEFFDAVDGSAMDTAAVAATGLFQPGLNFTAGAYGIALSHHRLWQQAAADETALTVAEDDAIFRADFARQQAEFLDALPPGWDIVLWGFNFDTAMALRLPFDMPAALSFSHNHVRQAIQNFQSFQGPPTACRLDFCFGLPAYSISPAGARRFLKELFPLRDYTRVYPLIPKPIRNQGIDIAMNQVYPGANAYVSFPPLVVTPNDRVNSTVQTSGALKN
jgi:GR25 family glycosyltransferase involved in LPS biosynthesis